MISSIKTMFRRARMKKKSPSEGAGNTQEIVSELQNIQFSIQNLNARINSIAESVKEIPYLMDRTSIMLAKLEELDNSGRSVARAAIEIPYLMDRTSIIISKINEIQKIHGPFGIMYPDDSMFVHTVFQNKYFIDANDLVMAPFIVCHRVWEPEISQFLYNSLHEDSSFVDVGANFGYFTILAASKIGNSSSGHVISIEPNPKALSLLRKNISINWSMAPISLYAAAASDQSGRVKLFVPNDRASCASFQEDELLDNIQIEVDTVRIDDLITGGRPLDFLKIDAEGAEYQVLIGAKETIARSPGLVLVMEWAIYCLEGASDSGPQDVVAFFRSNGFRAYRIPDRAFSDDRDWLPFEVELDRLLDIRYDNFVFRRPNASNVSGMLVNA